MGLAGEKFVVRIPASTANLGSGFDSIGIAFQLYLTVTVEQSETLHFIWRGEELGGLEIGAADNLILQGMKKVSELVDQALPVLRLTVDSDIPLTRGLGSSASAFVAGLVIANECFGSPLTDEQLLWLATEEEGHPDNVGASLLGGILVASVDWQSKKVIYNQISFPEQLAILAAIPKYTLSTTLARDLLPEHYSKQDALFNLSRYGLLVSSLITGNLAGIEQGLEDRWHQPYRQELIPGFQKLVEQRKELGVLGFVISGAGPTILAIIEASANQEYIKESMRRQLTVNGFGLQLTKIEVDHSGYQVQRDPVNCL